MIDLEILELLGDHFDPEIKKLIDGSDFNAEIFDLIGGSSYDFEIDDLIGGWDKPLPVTLHGGHLTKIAHAVHMLTRADMRVYQNYMAKRIIDDPFVFAALFMGAGKTISSLTAIRDLLDDGVIFRVLIVAPLLVAEVTWPDEIVSWEHTKDLTYEVLTGSAERREARARNETDIHIINRENIPWLVEFWGEDWPYDAVFIDEFQSFKNPRKRTDPTKKAVQGAEKAAALIANPDDNLDSYTRALQGELRKLKRNSTRFGSMCKARKYIKRLVGLSGTPAPNGLLDLWAPVYLLDQGQRLGTTYNSFRERWFVSGYDGYSYKPRVGAFEEIMSRLQDIMISMRSEDFLTLPPVIHNIIEAPLPPKAMEEYKKFERTLKSELYDVKASSQGVLTNKLLQFCNGSLYQEDGQDVEVHCAKLDALERIVEEAAGQPVLVAYSYQFDLRKILKKFPKAVTLREDSDAVRRWNAGQIPMLVCHPASAGHGLNLQKGGHIAVWYGFSYSLELYLQLNKRLHRPGQQETVVIHHIVAPGTADEDVLVALNSKETTQDNVIDAVRVRLEAMGHEQVQG